MLVLSEKNKKKSSLFGFTLIEMMIVIAIMTIITGTVIGFNRNSDRKLALYREARKVAYSLRQAQALAMQAKTVGGKSTCAWEVKVKTTASTSYELIATICKEGPTPETTTIQETINLGTIARFRVTSDTSIVFDSPLGSKSGSDFFIIESTKGTPTISNTINVNTVGDVSIQ
ncbi:MAG: prepilin-type N-terminal cleavage/methylation domain-containing protein [Candidatus Parcubacteria bacterium]|nr:prepilin-type N-terminal cleavage/methylation domain-containing protein [Candidatus Parcubacteria bacterium]